MENFVHFHSVNVQARFPVNRPLLVCRLGLKMMGFYALYLMNPCKPVVFSRTEDETLWLEQMFNVDIWTRWCGQDA